ncbi:hypothetical protein ACQ4PT_062879 [Festuca glaucescens]
MATMVKLGVLILVVAAVAGTGNGAGFLVPGSEVCDYKFEIKTGTGGTDATVTVGAYGWNNAGWTVALGQRSLLNSIPFFRLPSPASATPPPDAPAALFRPPPLLLQLGRAAPPPLLQGQCLAGQGEAEAAPAGAPARLLLVPAAAPEPPPAPLRRVEARGRGASSRGAPVPEAHAGTAEEEGLRRRIPQARPMLCAAHPICQRELAAGHRSKSHPGRPIGVGEPATAMQAPFLRRRRCRGTGGRPDEAGERHRDLGSRRRRSWAKGAAFIPCGHTFCRGCACELLAGRGRCPLCNAAIVDVLDIF